MSDDLLKPPLVVGEESAEGFKQPPLAKDPLHFGHVPDKTELEGANHPRKLATGVWGRVGLLFWQGGSKYDAFLVAASAQVGQVMLTLPHAFSQTGLIPGIVLQIVCAAVSIYTLYMLLILYLDRKNRMIKDGVWYDADGSGNRTRITSYYEVVGYLTNKWLAYFSVVVVIITAVGTCLPQIISASSNLYIINGSLEKRTWALIFGGIMGGSLLIPNFRHMRLFTFFALFATVFTAFYMIITSGLHMANHGVSGVGWTRNPVGDLSDWFTGFTTLLFTFGGHYMLMEVLDSMYQPGRFHIHYAGAYPCIMFLTLPTATIVDWAYPDQIVDAGNAYSVFPRSTVRNASIGLLVAHTCVAFLLFIMPLYIMNVPL
ncbi:hypothetical protein WJX73_006480 [Symbiochloris irregularis]|uniref:Amino acid transporter transmembrane domain-containing protein n=1 Tax=Symbiochloris irregularis TaxID=706552 RepID=A0AAW1PCT4_9CHLO